MFFIVLEEKTNYGQFNSIFPLSKIRERERERAVQLILKIILIKKIIIKKLTFTYSYSAAIQILEFNSTSKITFESKDMKYRR